MSNQKPFYATVTFRTDSIVRFAQFLREYMLNPFYAAKIEIATTINEAVMIFLREDFMEPAIRLAEECNLEVTVVNELD